MIMPQTRYQLILIQSKTHPRHLYTSFVAKSQTLHCMALVCLQVVRMVYPVVRKVYPDMDMILLHLRLKPHFLVVKFTSEGFI